MFGFGKAKANEVRIESPLLIALRDRDPDGTMTVRIDPAQVASGGEAGIILADVARHFARALAQTGKAESEAAALAEIRALWSAELDHPTQAMQGNLTTQE